MKHLLLFLTSLLMTIMVLCFITGCSQNTVKESPISTANPEIADKVKDLLGKMTLEDKVGEMTQLAIDVLSVGEPYGLKIPNELDEEKMRKVLVDLKVGSILNIGNYAYTREHWHEIISKIQQLATQEKASGIPVIYGIDAVHGANYTKGATLFPQQIGLAASWNPELAKRSAAITAYETRASSIPWTFSPVLDMGRDPRWSRIWEGFGEDVHLATKMGTAMIKGYEGEDPGDPTQVASCMKHFLGYSVPWTGKDRTPAYIPERQLQEYFVPPFKAAIDVGARTIMINSGEMNGIPVHCNPAILTDLLRGQLGFKGVAVSDWEDIILLVSRHRVAKDHKEAIKMSINAGLDMSMVPMNTEFPVLLKELVEEGEVPMSRIDESVSRILALKFELGLFEHPIYPLEKHSNFGSEEHAAVALEAAQETIILAKNDKKILPLSKEAKVLIVGPTANSLNALNGGWTGTWQGSDPEHNTPGKLTILEAVKEKVGANKVRYVEGTTINEAKDIAAARSAAKGVSAAIVCLGEMPYTELPGNIEDLNLPVVQQQLVREIAKSGKPIILVMTEGRPRIIREIEPLADAVLLAMLPGNEGGKAIANILYGDYNPNAKLPITYPSSANSLLTYDHKGTERIHIDFSTNAFQPQWEFGHGLSYTTFEYSDLQVELGPKSIQVQVKLSNAGEQKGKEVVQVYVTDKVASVTPSVKRLRAFEKVELAAEESKTITFEIGLDELAFVGRDNQWITEDGAFEVHVGGLTEAFVLGAK